MIKTNIPNAMASSMFPPKIAEYSVKCPEYYKDSACADIIDYYCPDIFNQQIAQNRQNSKVIIICPSEEKAKKLYESEYLSQISFLVADKNNGNGGTGSLKILWPNGHKKCVIMKQCEFKQLSMDSKLIIFTSPPKNSQMYIRVIQAIRKLQVCVVCYCTKEIKDMCIFQSEIGRRFAMLIPPQVQSDSDDEYNQPVTNASCRKQKQEHSHELYKVVIKNIQIQTNEKDVKQFLMSNNVATQNVQLIYSKMANRRHRFNSSTGTKTAFVECLTKSDHQRAIAITGKFLNGNKLIIQNYLPRN